MKAQQSAAASCAVLGEASLSGRQARNIRPASEVAYATTDIIVFSKRFYKNPSGVKSATQNLHNKGKPAEIDTDKHSTQKWRGASGVECGFQYTGLRCAASGHLAPEARAWDQGLGEQMAVALQEEVYL